MEEEYVGMGRRIILCVIFLTLCFMTCFAEFPIVKGAETGVVFTDANDQITIERERKDLRSYRLEK